MDSFRSRHDCIQVFLFRVCTFVVGDRAGSGEPGLLIGPETERAEGGCSRYEEDSGKLTGLRAWNFYLMPEPSSRRLHAFISRHQNTYKEVHGNVYGDVAAMLSTIPLSFGVL